MGHVADGLLVVDSDLIIDFLRGAEPGASRVQRWLQERRLRVTAVSAFELRLGADFIGRQAQIEMLLQRRALPLDVLGALEAGKVFVALRAEGRGIDVKDSLQAGICLRFDLPFATRNLRHFERVPGLRLELGKA
jgi:tRNA(fMet)-specific endonuclease VapC